MSEAENLNPSGATPTPSNQSDSSTGERKRPSVLAVASETMKFIDRAEKDKSINVRTDDKRSVIFASASFAVGMVFLFLFMINPGLRPVCIGLALISDFLFGMAILWYVLLRIGVLRSVEPRYALLCWQLFLGAGALFAFYTMNIAFAFFTLYSTNVVPQLPQ